MKYFGGTRQIKEIVKMNGGCRIDEYKILEKSGGYAVYEYNEEIFRTKKLNTAIDWLADEGVVEETRFRLTSYQKDILRQRIWEFIGTVILGGISMGIMSVIFIAWFLGF
jgi:hypothetical protein